MFDQERIKISTSIRFKPEQVQFFKDNAHKFGFDENITMADFWEQIYTRALIAAECIAANDTPIIPAEKMEPSIAVPKYAHGTVLAKFTPEQFKNIISIYTVAKKVNWVNSFAEFVNEMVAIHQKNGALVMDAEDIAYLNSIELPDVIIE